MIKTIRLENFKAFGAGQGAIPIRPITLITGEAATGKSALLHALPYAASLVAGRGPDTEGARFASGTVAFGGFRNLVHRHDRSRYVTLELGVEAAVPKRFRVDPTVATQTVVVRMEIGSFRADGRPDERGPRVFAETIYLTIADARHATEDRSSMTWTPRFRVSLSPELDTDVADELARTRARFAEYVESLDAGMVATDRLIDGFPSTAAELFRGWPLELSVENHDCGPREGLEAKTKRRSEFLKAVIGRGVSDAVSRHSDDAFTGLSLSLLASGPSTPENEPIPESEREALHTQIMEALSDYFLDPSTEAPAEGLSTVEAMSECLSPHERTALGSLQVFIEDTARAVREALRGLRYLAPWRPFPGRLILTSISADAPVCGTWSRLTNDEDLRTEVNECLRRDFTSPRLRIDVATAGVEPPDIGESPVDDHTSSAGPTWRLPVLVDTDTGTVVRTVDGGAGIGQLAAVLVEMLASKGEIVICESPESQLSAAAQRSLGDLIIRSAMKNRNTLLLETHSDTIIRSLLERIRETARGEHRHDGLALRAEDIAILHFSRTVEGEVRVECLPVDADHDPQGRNPIGTHASA